MPLPRASLRSYLCSAKNAINTAVLQASPVTFVVGNESADLDSLCSAVVFGYLRTYAPTSRSNTLYIPISNIPRPDLALRPELVPVLSHANLRPSDLITLSDLPLITPDHSRLAPENTKWILVDHNAMQHDLGRLYGSRVVGCVDHHDEEGKVPRNCGEEPRIVKKSGSCSSLVVEYCRETWDALSTMSKDTEVASWNAELAWLALAPILIDTINLTSESKVTPADISAVRYLEDWITAQPGHHYRSAEYFEEVTAAKENIGSLSLADILKKDYKQWTEASSMNIGVSAVVKDIQFLIDRAGDTDKFFGVLDAFARERNLSLYSIMTTSTTAGKFRRELLTCAVDEKGVEAAKKFEADTKESLGLQPWREGSLDIDGESQWRRCWWQQRVEHSRKQVAPLLRTAVAQAL